jgi:hypothetical protein
VLVEEGRDPRIERRIDTVLQESDKFNEVETRSVNKSSRCDLLVLQDEHGDKRLLIPYLGDSSHALDTRLELLRVVGLVTTIAGSVHSLRSVVDALLDVVFL